MELIFTTPGTYLNVKDGLIAINSDNQKSTISPANMTRENTIQAFCHQFANSLLT
jgi:hypothetical protein